jgi:catabolite regulation protein CreA
MTRIKIALTFLTLVSMTIVFACKQNNSNKKVTQTGNVFFENQVLTIDTFSTFPPEIDGCSCYFSNDSTEFKKEAYIYVNDYAQTSFLKINGVVTKFTQIDYKEIDSGNTNTKYKSNNFELTIESKDGIQNGDETWLKTGTIKLTDENGKTITKSFYGECGC